MNCCKQKPITLFRGDDTNAFNLRTITIRLSGSLSLVHAKAKFSLLGFTKEWTNEETATGELTLVFSSEDTKPMPIGKCFGTLSLYDIEGVAPEQAGKLLTVSNSIPFEISNHVEGLPDENYNINVVISGDTTIDIKFEITGGASVILDDTVTQSSANGVKSSGIWSWVKSLLPSWLTPSREEPPTQAQVAAKSSKLVIRAKSKDTPWNIVKADGHEEYDVGIEWFDEGEMSEGWGWLVRDGGDYTLPDGGENHDPLATHLSCAYIIETADRPAYYSPSEEPGKVVPSAETVASTAPSVNASASALAGAKATYDFVNSSVNAMAAFFLAKDDGTSFATRAELVACTSFLRNGLTGQKPTQNDYTIVVNDETNPIYQAGVFAVYSKWTATDDYVGYWVDYNGTKTLVTSANKDSLGIVVGSNSPTVPYTRIVPTSRYSYQGEWETAGANGWRFQYSINTSGFTAAQLAALNSGASAELFAQIAQSLAAKADKNGDSDEDFAAKNVNSSGTLSVGEILCGGVIHADGDINCLDENGNLHHLTAKLNADDPVLTATAPSVDADETALAGAKATGTALAEKLSPDDVKSFARVSEHGYLVDGDGNDIDAGKIPMPTGVGAVDQAIDLKADKDTITPADFVAKTSGSYEQGEIVRYDGANYKRNSTAGADTSWVASHWTEATDADLAARLKMLKSDGTATDEFATDLLGKQVANAKVRYALASASSATMVDRTVNILTMTADETLVFPTATTHDGKTYARDFLLKLAYTAGTMTLPTGVTKVGDELSFTAGKTYLLAFTEIAANQFYVRSIEIA